jgi:hypothetical protein
MNIRLKWDIPRQLKELGLKPGNEFQDVELVPMQRKGAVRIKFMNGDEENVAVVFKENYIRI